MSQRFINTSFIYSQPFESGSLKDSEPQNLNDTHSDGNHLHLVLATLKGSCMLTVIISTIFGNLLIMVSVYRTDRLRTLTNSFVVSLACADLMVAILVMPFSASQEISGRWFLGRVICDLFNANDVQFSTSSLLHLCCISVDRYIAITDPFHYAARMTRRRARWMLALVWGSSVLLSHVPIHLGWYSPLESEAATDLCQFKVNRVYGLISGAVSFWTPAAVMVVAYAKIYCEAKKQEDRIYSLTYSVGRCMVAVNHVKYLAVSDRQQPRTVSPSSTSARQERHKLKSEHKAARTLGFVMGAFIVCWLPFFSWYLTTSLCSEHCWTTPPALVPLLFWIGYLNSALNPIIYAFFNRDFRDAFQKVLGCENKAPQKTTTKNAHL